MEIFTSTETIAALFPQKVDFFQLELFSLIRNSKYTSDCLKGVLLFHCFMGSTVFFLVALNILKHPVL